MGRKLKKPRTTKQKRKPLIRKRKETRKKVMKILGQNLEIQFPATSVPKKTRRKKETRIPKNQKKTRKRRTKRRKRRRRRNLKRKSSSPSWKPSRNLWNSNWILLILMICQRNNLKHQEKS